jgi:hypothetical protein
VNIVWCQKWDWIDRFIPSETELDRYIPIPQKMKEMVERLLVEMKAEKGANRAKTNANLKQNEIT